tara:strand:+ start:2418 stop:3080 length:663 start_codon:yes stop_codon:yes gene_type:complete
MNIEELVASIEKKGVAVIKVAELVEDDAKTMVFDGSLSEYIESLSKLEAKVVFINSTKLTEDVFTCEIESHYEEFGVFAEDIDLSSVSPELKEYKKYEGNDACYHLLATSRNGSLAFHFQEEWWNGLLELLISVREKLEKDILEKHEETIKEKESEERILLEKINSLKNDDKFITCRTLKVKTAYALEKYPELNGLSKADLKNAISDIDAAIEAMLHSEY